jgi:hypothetical protein
MSNVGGKKRRQKVGEKSGRRWRKHGGNTVGRRSNSNELEQRVRIESKGEEY